jgi:MFS transporter, ACDE family, multidrug resistance protein
VGTSKSTVLATLFFLAGLAQTITMTVLPIEALRLAGDAREVSALYFGVGVAGFIGRLTIPSLTRAIHRVGVIALGTGAICASAALLATTGTITGLMTGLFLNVFAFACSDVVLNLYVLDHVPRNELGRFEAKRIFFAAAPYTLGPWLGVYLQVSVASWVPFALSGVTAIVLLGFFLSSRLAVRTVLKAPGRQSLNPIRYLRRFFAQPRLFLAWGLAAGRTAWWGMFMVYAPIFAVQSGLGAEIGGAIVSVGLGAMWSIPLWGWLGRRFGLRRLLIAGYAATGFATFAVALAMGTSGLGAALLVLSALAAETIDGAGNSLYLRAVHPHERSEMTAVFITYRDAAQLVPPAVFAVLLTVFELQAVFVAGGLMMLALAGLARYIPRRF